MNINTIIIKVFESILVDSELVKIINNTGSVYIDDQIILHISR